MEGDPCVRRTCSAHAQLSFCFIDSLPSRLPACCLCLFNMPWQSAPPLIIICGAFALTGFALRGVDNLATGRVSNLSSCDVVFSALSFSRSELYSECAMILRSDLGRPSSFTAQSYYFLTTCTDPSNTPSLLSPSPSSLHRTAAL